MNSRHFATAVTLFLFAGTALAHPGHAPAGFASGFAHPFGGLDHLLAMLALGLFAARQTGRSRWLPPLAFLGSMLAGAALSAGAVALPAVEAGVAASVLILGLLGASLVRLTLAASLPLVALCAVLHGHAHHAEMGDGSTLAYVLGFMLATATLHALGYGLVRCLPDTRLALMANRAVGLGIAGAGALLLLGYG